MATHSDPSDDRIARFWDKYLAVLERARVKPTAARWYVARVEAYLETHKDRRLRDQGPKEVLSYLESVRGDHRLKDWQAVQAVHALELLFCEFLSVDWRREVDWDGRKAAFRALEPAHPTVARENRPVAPRVGSAAADGNPGNGDLAAIRKAHAAVLDRLVTEIRRRRYSIRSEQAAPSRPTRLGSAVSSPFTGIARRRSWERTPSWRSSSTWRCSETSRQARRIRR